MMQTAFPGETEDTKLDARLPSIATQGAQNIPAQPPAYGTQQPSGMEIPGQMPTAQPHQMWPSMQMPYPAPALLNPGPVIIPETGVDLRPASYLVLSLIVAFFCIILNITTLVFGITAIVLSVMSEVRKKNAQYGLAKTYGKGALGINIANIIYTAGFAITATAGMLGFLVGEC